MADEVPPQAPKRRVTDTIKEWSGATTALVGTAVAVFGALVTFGVINATKSDDKSRPTPTPTATAPREVRVDPASIRVTSRPDSLDPQGSAANANDYIADNLLDGSRRTAWVEGDPTGLGLPATLSFSLPGAVDLQRVTIVNGYAKDTAHFLENAAARIIEIQAGAQTLRHVLTHSPRPQTIRAPFGTTRKVVVRILSGYPGARFDDLAVSEVAFFTQR